MNSTVIAHGTDICTITDHLCMIMISQNGPNLIIIYYQRAETETLHTEGERDEIGTEKNDAIFDRKMGERKAMTPLLIISPHSVVQHKMLVRIRLMHKRSIRPQMHKPPKDENPYGGHLVEIDDKFDRHTSVLVQIRRE